MNKQELRSLIREEIKKILKEEDRDPKAETAFYQSLKVGDKVMYNGPDKNGFKKGDEVEIATYKSGPAFDKTITVKKGNSKLIVKGHGSLKPLNK